jgi:hypothetical protein
MAVVWQNSLDGGLVVADTFERIEVDTWGTSTSGHTYVESGGVASDRSVSGGRGRLVLSSTPSSVRTQYLSTIVTDVEGLVAITPDQVSAGADAYPGIMLRLDTGTAYYRARLVLRPDGTVRLQILRVSTLVVPEVVTGLAYTAGTTIWLRARVDGHRIRARAWLDGTAEPGTWPADGTVTAGMGLVETGRPGVIVSGSASLTNVNPGYAFDSLSIRGHVAATAANSTSYGSALEINEIVAYSPDWAAAGPSSARYGTVNGTTGGTTYSVVPSAASWSLRTYAYLPAAGRQFVYGGASGAPVLWDIDPDGGTYRIAGQDVTAHAAHLVGQPWRAEVAVTGGTATWRVWWTDPHSVGPPDWTHSRSAAGWGALTEVSVNGGGYGTPPSYADEIAVGQGEWIGPAVPVTGTATGGLVVSGTADGHKTGTGTATGALAVAGGVEGGAASAARGRLAVSGTVSGGGIRYGTAEGVLVADDPAAGFRRVFGTAAGGLAAEGAVVQLVVDVPAVDAIARAVQLAGTATPTGRLSCVARRT